MFVEVTWENWQSPPSILKKVKVKLAQEALSKCQNVQNNKIFEIFKMF